jgi:hypothetical protein
LETERAPPRSLACSLILLSAFVPIVLRVTFSLKSTFKIHDSISQNSVFTVLNYPIYRFLIAIIPICPLRMPNALSVAGIN